MQNASISLNIYAICANILAGDTMNNVKIYNNLPDEAKKIRTNVFINEQGFNDEFDEIDGRSLHFLLFKDNNAIATGRMFTDDDGKSYHIGRVAVLKEYRKYHAGSELMTAMIEKSKELKAEKIVLSAQCRVKEFYKKLGFTEVGDIYYDEYCPHIQMELKL